MTVALALLGLGPALIVRASVQDVTPPEPLPLGGYTERQRAPFEPGGERLYARTIVLEQGSVRVALVSFEALTIPESLRDAVRARLPKDVGLFLAATHTHCAPDSQMLNSRMTFSIPGIATYDRRWAAWYAERIADGVLRALRAEGHPVESLRVRRGALAMNRGRREGAQPDPIATEVSLGPVRIVHYAAHPTLLGQDVHTLNGDWPGDIAKRLGASVLVGPIGDVSPVPPSPDGGVENPRLYGEMFSQSLLKHRARPVAPGTLRWHEEPIRLDSPRPHPEFAVSNGIPETLAQSLVDRFAPKQATLSLLAVGSVLFVGVPGEPTAQLGRTLQWQARERGFPQALVVSITNGWLGYVLTAPDYGRGGYEARLAFHGPGTAARLEEALVRGLKRLDQPGRVARSWLGHSR